MRRKLKIWRTIITEIVIMALGVMCCIMPLPWRLIVPIIIGARSILLRAHRQLKDLPSELPDDKLKKKSEVTNNNASKKEGGGQKARGAAQKGDSKKAAPKGSGKEKNRQKKT